ncbi:LOW QUALITY PROTEIN: calmodulin-binding receptor kinase CaMRLK [Phoenix dactylifera]|uniref:LOW QUALITY PROTEIN: calmodulin-binding receptor kinase CaMRLK n=1 Tax=Phoenix dactylifera TaxID=42345 RepID=A0A8B9AQH3_PHODC|nr:LOW QUALITY PROTEIN: calmodulin-binding receptor kinase CaMRLK [Phoenix dactylifera]
MSPSSLLLLVLLLLLTLPSFSHSSCHPSDRDLLSLAFSSVSGFQLPDLAPDDDRNCSKIRQIRLPNRNLSGTVSWVFLRNITSLQVLDLSSNALEGSIPGRFWFAPALLEVNLAANRFGGAIRLEPGPSGTAQLPLKVLNVSDNRLTSAVGLSGFGGLQVLDLSRNDVGVVPVGLEALIGLKHLDVSHNSMAGNFPKDFPPLAGLGFLNISFNNFTGVVKPMEVKKFERSAFIKAGSLNFSSSTQAAAGPTSSSSLASHGKKRKSKSHEGALKLGVTIAAASLVVFSVSLCFICRDEEEEEEKGTEGWVEGRGPSGRGLDSAGGGGKEARWGAEARWAAAPVVVFEKPLMELTFADLATATSGFGRESQLAEGGRSGPAFRVVLPGDMHVVIRVLEAAREVDEREATAAFRDLARLRHPNLLPLLGYCIAGREKLLLYEYIEKGDLHRWLHELPAARPDVEDWSSDTWEINHGEEKRPPPAAPGEVGNWPTRHRIALGVARGLAFLHQGWAGSWQAVVHGHLVPTNILLGEDLEPRIADFGVAAVGEGTAEGDVYSYGVVLMELVTGRETWSEAEVGWARRLVREGRAAEAVDPRLRVWPEWEKEAAECLRVGYLCTAESSEKRPTMQQVVGLIKDVRPPAAATSSSSSSSH